MWTSSLLLRFFSFFCTFVISAVGENTSGLFQWAFRDTTLPSTVPTCNTFPITIINAPNTNATNGVPPYYMISFPVGGTPQTTLLGSDVNNLVWTVTQPAGSQLLLSVVDSQQNPGGVPGQLVTVIAGQTTQCVITPINTRAFTVSANVSKNIETCAPWGITIAGGSPPYNITLLETNNPNVTNITMGFGADRFTFINRANPNGKLFAAVSDLEGRWATGTPVVNPIGLVSSSGNNTVVNEQDAQINAAAAAANRKHMAIIAVVVVIILLLFIGIGGAAFWHIRKQKQKARIQKNATLPTQFPQSEGSEARFTAAGTGRWQIRSDEKRGLRRGEDVEAPPYQEMEDVSSGPVASGSGSGPSRAGVQPLPTAGDSSTLLRSQLPRLRMPPEPLDDNQTPQPKSIDSTTGLLTGIATNGSHNQTPKSSMKSSVARSTTSRFTTFPTKPIRKSSGVALDITLSVSEAPSAVPIGERGPQSAAAGIPKP
ncbi:hypothetical protein BJ912DRAFT_924408 [Pholiota molesta]|nr:hypothetical protein BJ912DRAFT_924408 [Pholiota molesta]